MTYQVSIKSLGKKFSIKPSQTVLEAAIEAGVNLPYGCRNGACGTCKGQVLQGNIAHGDYQAGTLTDIDHAAGKALFCCARPLSDLEIECAVSADLNGVKPKIMPARVHSMEKLSVDIMVMQLKLPKGEHLQFSAGQYLEFLLKDGKRRAFSIASAPHQDEFLELHLRLIVGGQFTNYVFNEMPEKSIVRIEAPFGSFFLRESSQKPVIFVAGGTGFAPVKGIIEHMIHTKNTRPIMLYRGARILNELYMHDLCEKWATHLPHFTYTPVLSEAKVEDNWQGRTGYVHQAVLADLADLSSYQAYVCGAPEMVDVAHKSFQEQGLHADEFFSDAFTFANPAPK